MNAGKKHIGSTEAMQMTVKTSELLHLRAKHIIPTVMSTMTDAILNRDFDQFAELTMKVCEENLATSNVIECQLLALNLTPELLVHHYLR